MQPAIIESSGTFTEKRTAQPPMALAGSAHRPRSTASGSVQADSPPDNYFIGRFNSALTIADASRELGLPGSMFGQTDATLLIISDGVGNPRLRAVASRIAVDAAAGAALDHMEHRANAKSALDQTIPGIRRQLSKAIEASNNAIREATADRAPHSAPAGSSMTIGYLVWPLLYVAHVGDTGALIVRNRKVIRLTEEHSLPSLEREERNVPWHRALWNLLGDDESAVAPQLTKYSLEKYDTLVLCSTAILNTVPDADVVRIMTSQLSPRAKAQQLVLTAAAAKPDSTSVAIVGTYDFQESAGDIPSR
jgi:serine/threonine protein phosphatase PrpC